MSDTTRTVLPLSNSSDGPTRARGALWRSAKRMPRRRGCVQLDFLWVYDVRAGRTVRKRRVRELVAASAGVNGFGRTHGWIDPSWRTQRVNDSRCGTWTTQLSTKNVILRRRIRCDREHEDCRVNRGFVRAETSGRRPMRKRRWAWFENLASPPALVLPCAHEHT